MIRSAIRILEALVFSALLGMVLVTQATAYTTQVTTPRVTATLVSEYDSIVPGQPLWVALHFEIIPEWHTYWSNAGDSGNPPVIDWQLPEGFRASDIHWPYPERLPVGPLMNYGYSKQSTLLVRIIPPPSLTTGQAVTLHASASWLVCKVECIPEEGFFMLSLPVSSAGNQLATEWADTLRAARQRLPAPLPWDAVVDVASDTLQLQVELPGIDEPQLEDVYFYPAKYGIVEHAAEQRQQIDNGTLSLQLSRGDLRSQTLDQLDGVLVMREATADGPVTRAFTVAIPAAVRSATESSIPFTLILLFALLGGILLNIMPCVFPILSLKALQIVQSAAQAPAAVRQNGIIFTAGVVISFAVLAGILLLLQASGEAIGWGFQLQSPAFVLILTWLLLAMGLMFSGVWSFGENLMGMGQQLTSRRGKTGSFFTGVLAVIVATPCTAPFMGTALGYALTQSPVTAMTIFIVLGIGMALPWLLISFSPGLAKRLPKPGPWMETTKQVLAFPLYATCAWLLWVLSQQLEQASLLLAFLSLVVLSFLLWAWQKLRSTQHTLYKTAVGLLLGVLLVATVMQLQPAVNTATTSRGEWLTFDPLRLEELKRSGQPVLVNFTAAWCITCLVNEKVAISQERVQAQLREKGVVYMKGDWTNKDPQITEMLRRYERSGVPLYLLFPGNGQEALVLPNILTEGILTDALQQVATP
jgi:thiol:disulfide interchange protein DsbD